MAETTKSTPTPEQKPAPSAQAPVAAGRTQSGEVADGAVTTRVPRGVGEAPADAKASHEGLKAAQEAVQKTLDEQNAKGYRGSQADPTPNENYSVAGVTAGLPTPETAVYTPRSS